MQLSKETLQKVALFKGKHLQLKKELQELKEFKKLNTSAYSLQNTELLKKAQFQLDGFKPLKLDLEPTLKSIESAKKQHLKLANETLAKIQKEQQELKELLVNIENAKSIDQLTVDDIALAYPELDKTVEKMTKRGQWRVPGYYEKFGEFSIGF